MGRALISSGNPNYFTDHVPMPVTIRDSEDLMGTTMSEKSFLRASRWIKDCISDHAGCSEAQSSPQFFPTRVIDVSGHPDVVKLVISGKSQTGSKYLTLSHCWGLSPTVFSTAESLPEFTAGIETHTLPLTFRDAIVITRRLGYKYLWIDSLCIIQDSIQDWLQESSVMGRIYKFSECTISATASANSNGGCFFTRNSLQLQPCKITGNALHPENQDEVIYVYDHRIDYWRQMYQAPLSSRAWCLQERLLSPRVLHYMSDQLFWECRELEACEVFPQGFSVDYNSYSAKGTVNFKRVFKALEPGAYVSKNDEGFVMYGKTPYTDWQFILETYSNANLTKPTDKLVAIAGLVQEWAVRSQDTYLAGLWKNDIHRQLLWHSQLLQERLRKRSTPYRAPTWSWASMDAVVYNEIVDESLSDCVPISNFVRAEVEPSGPDPMGALLSASITLSGPLKTTALIRDSDGMYHIPAVSEGYIDEHIVEGGWYSICNPDIDIGQMKEATFLPLIRISVGSRSEPTVNGLMLTPRVPPMTDGEGFYERIGVFELSCDHACQWFDGAVEQTVTIF